MLYTNWTCEHFTDLHYDVVEDNVIFQPNLHPCRESSSTCEAQHLFMPIKTCSPSFVSMGAWHSAVPVTIIMVSKGANRWKSNGTKSGLLGRCSKLSTQNLSQASVQHRLVRICHHSNQPTSINLGVTKHFNNWNYTAFNDRQDGA